MEEEGEKGNGDPHISTLVSEWQELYFRHSDFSRHPRTSNIDLRIPDGTGCDGFCRRRKSASRTLVPHPIRSSLGEFSAFARTSRHPSTRFRARRLDRGWCLPGFSFSHMGIWSLMKIMRYLFWKTFFRDCLNSSRYDFWYVANKSMNPRFVYFKKTF